MARYDDTFVGRFLEPWNRHDVDGALALMTDDCVWEVTRGREPHGILYTGQTAVRSAIVEAYDTYIEEAWKNAELEEIEDLAAELLGKAQEAQSIEDDLFCILYLAFRCGFKTAIGNIRISMSE